MFGMPETRDRLRAEQAISAISYEPTLPWLTDMILNFPMYVLAGMLWFLSPAICQATLSNIRTVHEETTGSNEKQFGLAMSVMDPVNANKSL
jgi:hypothetical protein